MAMVVCWTCGGHTPDTRHFYIRSTLSVPPIQTGRKPIYASEARMYFDYTIYTSGVWNMHATGSRGLARMERLD